MKFLIKFKCTNSWGQSIMTPLENKLINQERKL
ncbi:hypothetical protein [Escherichia phage UPEC07]|nr:hypothetical protein [Escherichia phage UPEC07]